MGGGGGGGGGGIVGGPGTELRGRGTGLLVGGGRGGLVPPLQSARPSVRTRPSSDIFLFLLFFPSVPGPLFRF